MSRSADNGSESSLPTQAVPTLHSSPPDLNCGASSPEMESESTFKSEPPVNQRAEGSQQLSRRGSSKETEPAPPSAQQPQGDADASTETEGEDEEEDEEESEEDESDSDPSESIANFDWESLHARYHDAINQCQSHEAELMQEWDSLMNVLLGSHNEPVPAY